MDEVRKLVDVPEEKDVMESLALICSTVWNASRLALSPDGSHALVKALRQIEEREPELAPVYDVIIGRARKMYPKDRRVITSVTVEVKDGEMQVTAASTGG